MGYLGMDIKDIPVIYATNDAYAPMVAASLRSLIRCANPVRHYRICVMHTSLTQTHQVKLKTMESKNVSIDLFDASELLQEEVWPFSQRFGGEIYLRLYAPQVYSQYPKLVYLDADTIVLRDVADLYDVPMNGATLAAGWSFATPFMDGYVHRTVGLKPREYFNSGVLVLNPARFEAEKIRLRCQQILREKPQLICFDQDALNLALRGVYYCLPDQWNVQWTNYLHPAYDLSERPSRSQRDRMTAAERDPFVLHYSSEFKPWDYPNAWGAQLFWNAAFDTPYLAEFSALFAHKKETPQVFHSISPPWRAFRRNLALAGWTYAMKELLSNILRLDGEVPC